MPKALYYMKWVFPTSIFWLIAIAMFIPAYENQSFYFLSISSLFFLILNSIASWIAGFYLSAKYTDESGSKPYRLAIALVFNVWGQYFFYRKFTNVTARKSLSIFDLFYAFSLFIILTVSFIMSVGIGNEF